MAHKNYEQTGIGSVVELGKGGAKIKENSGTVEIKNNTDTAFVKLRAAHPVDLNDVVTLQYLKTKGDVVVTGQINGGSPPAAGVAGRVYVCTTTGGGYTIKKLYLDNGVTWEDVGPDEGISIAVTDALTGGALEFTADHAYLWDADASTWVDIGPSSIGISGTVQCRTVNLAFDSSGSINIGAALPANATALRVSINVTQAFNGTAPTVTVGDIGDTDRLMTAVGNNLKDATLFVAENSYLYSLSTQLTVTYVASASGSGAAQIIVHYLNA